MPAISIEQPTSEADLATVKQLFIDYVDWLGLDLTFQDIDEEIGTFPDSYCLLLAAKVDGVVAAAVGMKEFAPEICEMKRMYCRPDYRGHGLGRKLAERLVDEARAMGYRMMVLDTLPKLETAIDLYKSMGFRERGPYYDNPFPEAIYMELAL